MSRSTSSSVHLSHTSVRRHETTRAISRAAGVRALFLAFLYAHRLPLQFIDIAVFHTLALVIRLVGRLVGAARRRRRRPSLIALIVHREARSRSCGMCGRVGPDPPIRDRAGSLQPPRSITHQVSLISARSRPGRFIHFECTTRLGPHSRHTLVLLKNFFELPNSSFRKSSRQMFSIRPY